MQNRPGSLYMRAYMYYIGVECTKIGLMRYVFHYVLSSDKAGSTGTLLEMPVLECLISVPNLVKVWHTRWGGGNLWDISFKPPKPNVIGQYTVTIPNTVKRNT